MANDKLESALKDFRNAANNLEIAKRDDDWVKGARFLDDLNGALDDLEQALEGSDRSAVTSQPDTARMAAAAPGVHEQVNKVRISDFFRNVGEGVVQAQRMLDTRSAEYLQQKPDHAPPSVFRVPRASAEIHFAFEETNSKGFNLLIFGANDERRSQLQHKVSFDIIAAPPPPDMIANLGASIMHDAFVVDRDERALVREKLRAYATEIGEDSTRGEHAAGLADDDHFPNVLILRSKKFWVLMYPKELALDVGYVFREGDEPPDLRGSWEPIADMQPRFHRLMELFTELAETQGEWIRAQNAAQLPQDE